MLAEMEAKPKLCIEDDDVGLVPMKHASKQPVEVDDVDALIAEFALVEKPVRKAEPQEEMH